MKIYPPMPTSKAPIPEALTQAAQRVRDATLRRLEVVFNDHALRHTAEMWSSLEEAVDVLAAMADGRCPPYIYVSPIDPGVGKTTAYLCFLKALTEEPELAEVGAICFTYTRAEIETLATQVGLPKDRYAILTSDDELNELGAEEAGTAPVVFTTQQRLAVMAERAAFCDMRPFFYQGRPRRLRIWDETIEAAEAVVLDHYSVGLLGKALADAGQNEFADGLIAFQGKLMGLSNGDVVDVPPLPASVATSSVRDFLKLYQKRGEAEWEAASAFATLAGTRAVLRVENRGRWLSSYREHLPADLAPLMVFDASARVKTTYDLWEKTRGGLVRLGAAKKDYRNLRVHHWKRGGGKWAFKDLDKMKPLLDTAASTIKQFPQDRWLVVVHKVSGGDLAVELKARLEPQVQRNVDVITWGKHRATNDFKEARRVMLLGTHFLPEAVYEGLARGALGLPASEPLPTTDLEATKLGEHRHAILQAVCRGAVRDMIDGACGTCDAYVVASVRSQIGTTFTDVFPGCTVRDWTPAGLKLTGEKEKAFQYIYERLDGYAEDVPVPEVYKHLKIDKGSFKKVRKHAKFKQCLAEAGIEERTVDGTGELVFAVKIGFDELPEVWPDLIKKEAA